MSTQRYSVTPHVATTYPAYQPSRASWIGDVPSHWQVVPHRALFDEVKDRAHPDEEMLSVTISRGVIKQRALLDGSSKKDSSNTDRAAYKLVQVGDIAYNKMRAWQGALGTSALRGIVSPAYIVVRLRGGHNPRYFHYLFRTAAFAKEAERWSYGITSDMWSLRPEHFKLIQSCVPPRSEQDSIVRFLDHLDRDIRRLIGTKRRMVDLLEEHKRGIIQQAVTRGIGPEVSLKPTGIEGVGNVPKHWEVRRIASFSPKITNGWVGPTRDILRDSGTAYVQSLHIKHGAIRFAKKYFVSEEWLDNHAKVRLHEGDVVVVQTGDIGQVACIPPEFDGAGCHALIIIRTDPTVMTGKFLDLVLRSQYGYDSLKKMQTGALHPHLNCTWVREIVVPVPPIPEQLAILVSLEGAVARVNTGIEHAERDIYLAEEYRDRIISDSVFGRLDVRHVAAGLPERRDESPSSEVEGEEEVFEGDGTQEEVEA